jgi:hypothetical protein
MTDSETWAKSRALGRGRFVLLYGVLGWGIPTAILFVLIRCYQDGWNSFLFHLISALVLFPLGGILVGHSMWKRLERRHVRSAGASGE